MGSRNSAWSDSFDSTNFEAGTNDAMSCILHAQTIPQDLTGSDEERWRHASPHIRCLPLANGVRVLDA